MQTRVSSKGQVVLPSPIRRKLGLRTGDPLDAEVESGRIPTAFAQVRRVFSLTPSPGFPCSVATEGHLAQLAKTNDAMLATLDKRIPRAFLIPRSK